MGSRAFFVARSRKVAGMSIYDRMAAHHHRRKRLARRGEFSAYAAPWWSTQNEFGELFTRRGEVLVTPQQRALLEVLGEAPEQTFPTIRAWVEAALPLLESASPAAARRCVQRMPAIWVSRTPYGRGSLCALQARGRAIMEGEIPVWIRGEGRYSNTNGHQLIHGQEILSRLSLGQLLDRVMRIQETLAETAEAGEEHQARTSLVEGEVVLSSWRFARDRQRERDDGDQLMKSQLAAERGDLQQFVRSVGVLRRRSLAAAARYALSFERPEQKLHALEEVVLAAEAYELGFAEAGVRRQKCREEQLHSLTLRLAEVIPA